MLFNSFVFVLFLAIVLPVYYALSHRWQNRFLLVASYVFYGYWDWRFLGLLAISTVLDFALALLIAGTDSPRRKKRRVALSVVVNLGILGFFKYFDFFVDSAAVLLESAGLQANLPMLRVVLPVGISFYTFQSMAYTIDVYRGIQPPTRNLLDFALYVAYFPQLVAGPIERASRLLPQIQSPRRVGQAQWERGAQLILWGYVKKVAIADGLAPYADAVFRDPSSFSGLSLWLGVYCFAVQIYCDFSGYTDIARGVSRLLGIELMENFRQPYLSRNITEFWRRWHISLSTWLRDYLYVPLGGNRRGPAMQYRNLMITMLLGGLWHGAAWTFVVWGGLHGLFLATHKYMTRGRKIGQEAPPATARERLVFVGKALGTFHLVCLAWVFFRAPDIGAALDCLGGMLAGMLVPGGTQQPLPGIGTALIIYGAATLLLDLGSWLPNRELPLSSRSPWWARGLAYAAGLLMVAYVREFTGEVFIYFQF
jgi:alginate O-acetyltransferase complex protein AlgI